MDVNESISRLLLKKFLDVPDWMGRAACKDSPLDPFYGDEQEDFTKLCETCPVISECRSKYTDFSQNVRPIQSGVFHGVNYGKKGDV